MNNSAFFLQRLNDHVQYLGKLKATLEDRGDFQGTDHHSCKLGLWLDQDGPKESSAISTEAFKIFNQLLTPHQRFHQISKQALECKAAGDVALMEDAMTEMFKLSNTLVNILMELDELSR